MTQPTETSTQQPGQSLILGKETIDPYIPSDLFLEQKVRNLRDRDFFLESKTPMALRSEDCTLVLFYNDMNREDRDLSFIWQEAANRASVVAFAAVNLRLETGVANAINLTKQDPNNPLYDFTPRGLPAIVVYRNHYPQAFYNGPRSVENIIDYALTLACDAQYHERAQIRVGADTFNLAIPGTVASPIPNTSTEFTLGKGLRQYGVTGKATSEVAIEQTGAPTAREMVTGGTVEGGEAPTEEEELQEV